MILQLFLHLTLLLHVVAGFQQTATSYTNASEEIKWKTPYPSSSVSLHKISFPTHYQIPIGVATLPLRSSETSFDYARAPSSSKAIKFTTALQSIRQALPVPSATSLAIPKLSLDVVRSSWWLLPMSLAVVPIYCAVQGTCATMPHWWPLTRMDYIMKTRHAALRVAGFLGSNVAYFLSGAFMLKKFRSNMNTQSKSLLSKLKPCRFGMLGVWILMSGVISTIFHSVQALGNYAVAESLCYIDHGVAITSGLYFMETCGFPSRRVLGLGALSLFFLVVTDSCYAFLHSTWHFLSAATATLWAFEAYENRRGALQV